MTMLVGVLKKKDNSISILYPSNGTKSQPSAYEMLIGKGGLSREVAEKTIAAKIKEGFKEKNVRPFYEAMQKGGLDAEKAMILLVKANLSPEIISFRITNVANLPTDRELRGAWTDDFDTDSVDIHNEKAREIFLNKLRIERDKKLEELDSLYNRTLEKKNEANRLSLKKIEQESDLILAEISAKKEKLRGITDGLKYYKIKDLSCPKCLEELKELGLLDFDSLENLNKQ